VGGEQGKNPDSRLSVIMFDQTAHCICNCQPFSSAPELRFRGGGTNFSPALLQASTCFKGPDAELLLPVLIFMTDGQTEDPNSALQCIQQLDEEVTDLQVHLVGFGNGAEVNLLHQMKSRTKDGYVHSANIGELENMFREIDQQLLIAVEDTLYTQVACSDITNPINQLDPFEVDGNDNWYMYCIDVADVLLWRNAQHFSLAGLAEHLFSQPITITVSASAAEKVREHLLASDSLSSGLRVTVMPYYNLCDATVWERTLSATIIFEPSGVIFDSSGENFGGIQIVLPSYVSLCGQSGDDDVQAHQQQARVLKTKKEFDEEVNEMADGSYPSFARKLWEVSDEDHNIAVVLHEDRHVTFKLDIHHFSGVTVISSLLATAFGVALIVSHTSNDWTWVSPQIPADQVGFYGEHAKSARQKILEDIYLQNRRVTRTPRAILEDCLRSLCHQLNPGDVCAFDNLMHEYAAKCRKLNRSCGRHKMEYDCFLSYRHASDKVTVDRVHDKLTLCFPNINIYYDKTEMQGILKKSFLQALAKCRVFVPIISCAAMQGHRLRSDATDPVDPLTQRHRVKDDNVLLEIETALALHEVYNNYSDVENGASNVVFVMPLIINDWVNTTDYDNNPH